MKDILKSIEKITEVPNKVMPYAFVMSVKYVEIIKKQVPNKEISLSNFMMYLTGVRVFALSNETFKEICEKQPNVNDSNRMFVFDNSLALDIFMVKYGITKWAEIED